MTVRMYLQKKYFTAQVVLDRQSLLEIQPMSREIHHLSLFNFYNGHLLSDHSTGDTVKSVWLARRCLMLMIME